jgi:predicted phosphodiesterase
MTRKQSEKYETDQERLFRFMKLPYPYHRPPQALAPITAGKILCISDPHVPYQNAVVHRHIQKHERDAETVVVSGDLGDYYSRSRFRKTRYVPFCDELAAVFQYLEWLATNFRTVRVMIGNHDNRPEKHVVGAIEGTGRVDLLIMTEQNMLKHLAAHFDNIEVVGAQLDSTDINLTHIYQHGDIIFTHGEISLKANSANLDRVEEYLDNWKHILDLAPFRVVAQGHNHRDSVDSSKDRKRFLLPTASDPFSIGFEYIYGSRMQGKPPAIGYSVFHQYKGVTDVNDSKNIVFPVRHGRTESIRVRNVREPASA